MPESLLTLLPPPYDLRVDYGDVPQQFAHVRFPRDGERAAAVVNIHGGYWRAKYDLAHAGHFCAALSTAGVVTINVEYRRVGHPGGGWPGTFEDVRRAFEYVLQHAVELRIDMRQPITLVGHSAGGQLALWLAAHQPRISRVVSLAGVLDLRRAWDLHLSNDAVVQFLGGTPDEVPERYKAASPMDLPIEDTEQLIVHGTHDEDVPMELSRIYATVKRQRGKNVRYIEIEQADHFDLIDPRSSAWREVESLMTG
jgi:acetyl esterase/lipase